MIIDCISDLHGFYPELEGGDLLIVAGDLTARDDYDQHGDFREWLQEQDYKQKFFVAGNHDNYLTKSFPYPLGVTFPNGTYLCDSGAEFEYDAFCEGHQITKTLKIWGSPWTAYFEGMNPKCMAFTLNYGCDTEEKLAEKWAMIPDDVDILVTHSPPYGTLDLIGHISLKEKNKFAGSKSLCRAFERINPSLHVFGHIHESYGAIKKPIINLNKRNMCTFVNASYVNELYEPVNKPIRIEL